MDVLRHATLHNGHDPILLFYPILFIIGMIIHPNSFIQIHASYRITFNCTILHSTLLHCTKLHSTSLNFTILHSTLLHCSAMHNYSLHCSLLPSVIVVEFKCWLLHYIADHFPALQFICSLLAVEFKCWLPIGQ